MKLPVSCLLLLAAQPPFLATAVMAADNSPVVAHISPYLGTGTSDTGRLSYANGLSFSADYRWEFTPGWTLGPRFEYLASSVGTDTNEGSKKALASYDNRIMAGGLRLGFPLSDSVSGYVLGMGGRGNSSLRIGQSQDHSYSAFSVDGVYGDYYALESGAEFQMHQNLSLQFGVLANRYQVKFDKATPNGSGMKAESKGLTLRDTASAIPGGRPYPEQDTFTTYALKLGIALHF